MIRLKTVADIEKLAEGGKILAAILDELKLATVSGVRPIELDELARQLVKEYKVTAAFLNYAPKGQPPFPAALCVSVNSAVVHGLPNDKRLENGDVVGIDMGIVYEKKYYLDSARTIGVGEVSKEAARLMSATKEALQLGIKQAQVGYTIGHIGAEIEARAKEDGFKVVRSLVGHGVGFAVHEDPRVPNYGQGGEGEELKEGLVIAIEPMLTFGSAEVKVAADNWTVETEHGGLAAHEEHTVAVTSSGPLVLTK